MKTKMIAVIMIISVSVLTLLMFAGIIGVVASNSVLDIIDEKIEDYRDQKQEISEKIKSINEQKKNMEKTISEQERELNRIREEISAEISEKDKMIAELNELKAGLEDLDGIISDAEKKYSDTVNLFLERSRLMVRYSEYSNLELLMNSENILDFASRANLFNHMISYDKEMIKEIKDIKADLDTKRQMQLAVKEERESILNELNETIKYLNSLEDKEVAQYESNLKNIQSLSALQAQLDAESKKADEMIGKLMAESKMYKYEGGKMLWPVRSWTRISDVFGYRAVHPITGLPAFHGGMDIAAYYGTDILAAAGGVVIVASYSSGSGNYIVIDHGGGVCTMYAHASKLIAGVGTVVKRGEVIALVGSTGNSTGNHLHFEVRVDNVKVDPMGYLDIPN